MMGRTSLLAVLTYLCLSSLPVLAAEPRSMTALGEYETPYRHITTALSWNLGPTGARGWVRGHRGGELYWGPNGKEILVTWVDPGSPADGALRPFDVIVGVDGKQFDEDARIALGKAIIEVERSGGKLEILRWRQGKTEEATIDIPTLGADATVVPGSVDGTKAIRETILRFLVATMSPNGYEMDAVWRGPNALFLLAHGRPEYLDLVRRNVRMVMDGTQPGSEYGPWNWQKGCNAILLCEYFLATGDKSVMPALHQTGEWLRASQSYLGGFGHGGPYGGYGHVGLPGLFSAIGLALMYESGVTDYNDVLEAAREFFLRGAHLGLMGYGGFDARTHVKTNYGDNGKCGAAAVLYDVLGNRNATKAFSQIACALAPYAESGHTGNFWSFAWGGMGAGIADAGYVQGYYDAMGWWYALARTWRGGLTSQPWTHTAEGHRSMQFLVSKGPETNAGGLGLTYCRPLRSLRILGAPKSVFSQQLDGVLADARQAIYDRDHAGCVGMLADFKSADATAAKWARELRSKAQRNLRSIEMTKEAIATNVARGDLYLAERQVHALKMIVSDADGDTAKFEEQLRKATGPDVIAAGKEYYGLMKRVRSGDWERFHRAPGIVLEPKKRAKMEALAKRDDAPYYAKLAAQALADWPPERETATTLVGEAFEIGASTKLYVGKAKDAAEGVNFTYYEFKANPAGPDEIRNMKPVKTGIGEGFDLKPRRRNDDFAFRFTTFFDVEEAGEFLFTLASDDGGWLMVDGKQVIDNGGLHGMTPAKTGAVDLAKGRHELEVVMFQGRYGFGLKVGVEARGTGSGWRKDIDFDVPDLTPGGALRLRVKGLAPVTVQLNGKVLCKLPKKRAKTTALNDPAWTLWEQITLQPKAVEVLRKGGNTLTVTSTGGDLGGTPEPMEVQLQAIRSEE